MAASIIVEQESGTYSGRAHPHNGYYAGDFRTGYDAPSDADLSARAASRSRW